MQEGYVYILKSDSTGRFYVGSCTDVNRRFDEHRRGHTYTTRKYGPWRIKLIMKCPSLNEARKLERKIKKWKSSKMTQRFIDANKHTQLTEQPQL